MGKGSFFCLKDEHLSNSNPQVFWFDLDYLMVARAALSASAHFTALLYVEKWCEDHFQKLSLGSDEDEMSDNPARPSAAEAELLLLEVWIRELLFGCC